MDAQSAIFSLSIESTTTTHIDAAGIALVGALANRLGRRSRGSASAHPFCCLSSNLWILTSPVDAKPFFRSSNR